MTSAYASRYRSDLSSLSSDLPPEPAGSTTAPTVGQPERTLIDAASTWPGEFSAWGPGQQMLATTFGTLRFIVTVMLAIWWLAGIGAALLDVTGS